MVEKQQEKLTFQDPLPDGSDPQLWLSHVQKKNVWIQNEEACALKFAQVYENCRLKCVDTKLDIN